MLTTVATVPDNADEVKVYAVTTRNRVRADSNIFDAGKATAPNYAEFTVSIPPNHKPAQIEWPKGRRANPAKDFAVTGQSVLSEQSFRAAVPRSGAAVDMSRYEVAAFDGPTLVFVDGAFRGDLSRIGKLAAGIAVLVVRLLEDYIVIPRVLGDAVGLSPLLVLVSVSAVALLFGEFAVLLAIPLAAVVATLVDVVVLEKNPAEQEVPTVIFAAQDVEAARRR